MNRSTPITIGLAVAALAAVPATASAAETIPLAKSGGKTTLKLAPGTAKALTSLGVRVAPVAGAKAGKAGIAFPVTGGSIESDASDGTVTHRGGLRFQAGGTKLQITSLTISVDRGTISVRAGKARVTPFKLDLSDAKITRPGLGFRISGVKVALNATGASVLNRTFGVRAFRNGTAIGTATVDAPASSIVFEGGRTDLALDPGAAQALTSLGVTPGLVGDASANPDGSFAFPITGGSVAAKSLAGSITHSGGISLTKDATRVELTSFTIDTRKSQLTALLGGQRVAILDLDLKKPMVAISGKTVTVSGVKATLTQGAADALNQAFGTTAFTKGLTLGAATVRGTAA